MGNHHSNGFGRRHALLGAGLLIGGSFARNAEAQSVSAAATPDEALQMLVDGNSRYAANKPHEKDFSVGRPARALGQAPFASILGCADSRVIPELAFDQGPGALFVVRVAGNFVTPDGLASLEFGAAVLGTKIIMVLGHTSCGAVKATVAALQTGNTLPGHIADLVRAMKPGVIPAMSQPGPDLERRATIANVQYTVQQLHNATPILAELVAKNKLRVVGGLYDLATGKIDLV